MKYHVVSFYGRGDAEGSVMRTLGMTEAAGIEEADVVIFPGGQDINPELYGEAPMRYTSFLQKRDDFELSMFELLREDQWKVGICRGAQLLCALNGGTLWQDVDRHAGTVHYTSVVDKDIAKKWGKDFFMCNSVHHQSVKSLPPGFTPIAAANAGGRKTSPTEVVYNDGWDNEVSWSKKDRTILFQGHPEFDHQETEDFFRVVIQHAMEIN